eukprot:3901712-Rhodomonas_salina.1
MRPPLDATHLDLSRSHPLRLSSRGLLPGRRQRKGMRGRRLETGERTCSGVKRRRCWKDLSTSSTLRRFRAKERRFGAEERRFRAEERRFGAEERRFGAEERRFRGEAVALAGAGGAQSAPLD